MGERRLCKPEVIGSSPFASIFTGPRSGSDAEASEGENPERSEGKQMPGSGIRDQRAVGGF